MLGGGFFHYPHGSLAEILPLAGWFFFAVFFGMGVFFSGILAGYQRGCFQPLNFNEEI